MTNHAWLLVKTNLLNSYGLVALRKAAPKEKMKYGLIGISVLIVALSFIGGMIAMFYVTSEQLNMLGMLYLLPALCIIATSALVFFIAMYKANSYLFSFKDFDLLMSLPVSGRAVLISKLSALYLDSLVYTLFGYVPMVISYGLVVNGGPLFYLVAAILFFFMPVIPIAAAVLLALPLAYFSARSRLSNVVMLVGTIILVLITLWLSFSMGTITSEEAMVNTVLSAKSVVGFYAPGLWLVNALTGSVSDLCLFTGVSVLAAAAFVFIYAKGFRAINAKLTERHATAGYKMQSLTVSGGLAALYRRELRSYFASHVYVVNTGIGAIMATAYIVLLVFMEPEQIMQMLEIPAAADMLVPVTLLVMAFCAIMSCTTACSISIEGNSLWLLKSLPVRFLDIAKAKIGVSLTISGPLLLLDTVFLSVVFGFDFIKALAACLVVVLLCLIVALGGLIVNLHFPRLDWKSQVQAVKQSASVIVAMLVHIVIVAVPCVLYVVLQMPPLMPFLFASAVYELLVCFAMYIYLRTVGERKFISL